MAEPKITKSQEIATDVAALLRARNPIIWIVSKEEARVERYLVEASASAGYVARTWDVAQGPREIDGKMVPYGDGDPTGMLGAIDRLARGEGGYEQQKAQRNVWIMRDLPPWLGGPAGAATLRMLRNLARFLPTTVRERAQAIVVLSPSGEVPPELANHASVIEWPMPDRAEIAAILDATVGGLGDKIEPLNGNRESAIDAAVGLSGEEAAACYAKSAVQLKKIDPPTVAQEKKRVIARERVLEWFDPLPGGLDAVGGLENLKGWLVSRKSAYSAAARAYGLPAPKGAMLVGKDGRMIANNPDIEPPKTREVKIGDRLVTQEWNGAMWKNIGEADRREVPAGYSRDENGNLKIDPGYMRDQIEMKKAGALTLAQDEASCIVYGMPREAVKMGSAMQSVALDRMAALKTDHLLRMQGGADYVADGGEIGTEDY